MRKNEENRLKYLAKVKEAKEKRIKERKAAEEKKLLESSRDVILKNIETEMPDSVPIFKKVNEVLYKTIQKVKLLAKEKVMTQEEKEIAKKEEDMKKEKEKLKKE